MKNQMIGHSLGIKEKVKFGNAEIFSIEIFEDFVRLGILRDRKENRHYHSDMFIIYKKDIEDRLWKLLLDKKILKKRVIMVAFESTEEKRIFEIDNYIFLPQFFEAERIMRFIVFPRDYLE